MDTGPTFLEFPFPPLTSFTRTDPAVSTLECLYLPFKNSCTDFDWLIICFVLALLLACELLEGGNQVLSKYLLND